MKYARLNTQATEVTEIVSFREEIDTALIRKAEDGFPQLRPLVSEARPVFDPKTHKLVGPAYQIRAGSVLQVFTVEPLTNDELADRITQKIEEAPALVRRLLFDLSNRVRVLEGRQPQTVQEFTATMVDLVERDR